MVAAFKIEQLDEGGFTVSDVSRREEDRRFQQNLKPEPLAAFDDLQDALNFVEGKFKAVASRPGTSQAQS